jgi:Fibronectin type III domain
VGLTWTNPAGPGLLNDTVEEGASCDDYSSSQSLGSPGTSFTQTGLASATSFCFSASAWNVSGQSPLSSPVTATTLPYAPSDLTVLSYNATTVSLVWKSPTGTILNDTVLWSSTSCAAFSEASSVGGSQTSYSVGGLKAGVSYCFSVEAWSAGGSSVLSSPVTQKTRGSNPATAPQHFVWPPVFGWPNFNVLNWLGLAVIATGLIVLVFYKRVRAGPIIGPVLVGAGVVLCFILTI